MADTGEIIAALIASGLIAHPGGHKIAGKRVDVPVRIDYRNGVERWQSDDDRKNAEIHAGGFEGQGLLARALEDKDAESSVRYANAIYKLLYPLTVKKITNGKSSGDVENLERTSGNKNVQGLLALSALLDFAQARKPNRNWSVDIAAPDGAPGLLYRRNF